jgi:hypothetical protein
MADFTQSEILNEISRIFRARLDPGRDGGTLNTEEEYEQLLEIASITFLLNVDSVFYLARLAANALSATTRKEIDILEDILVGLEELSNIGSPVRDTTILNNATTALLELDASLSVQGRPETSRFDKLMDDYAGELRGNVVDESARILTRPREDARNLIKTNLGKLSSLHDNLLLGVTGVRDLLSTFNELDIPSKTATNTFRNVRLNLERIIDRNENLADADNITVSRQSLLTTLASKVAVKLTAQFANPGDPKYRSPIKPIPPDLKHTGQVVGEGTPAAARTNGGPWQFPISAPLVISVDGGSPQTVELDKLAGSVMNGVNPENFNPAVGSRDLYILTDPNVYNLTVSTAPTPGAGNAHPVICNEAIVLGFKHLGSYVFHPDYNISFDEDVLPRAITEMRQLQSFTSLSYSPSTGFLTVSGAATVDDTASGLRNEHVGAYIRDNAGRRYEILEVISSTVALIDIRDGLSPDTGAATMNGQVVGIGDTKFSVRPRWAGGVGAGERMNVGPSVKAWRSDTGSKSLSTIITEMRTQPASQPYASNHSGAAVHDHVKPQPAAGDPEMLALAVRSRLNPFLQLVTSYTVVDTADPPSPQPLEEESAHDIFGLPSGKILESDFDSNDLLTPAELIGVINDNVTGAVASELETTLVTGSTLKTVFLDKKITDTAVNFLTSGVKSGDIIIIQGGVAVGAYQIDAVTQNELTIIRSEAFLSEEINLPYVVLRKQVEIASSTSGVRSSISIVSGPVEMDLPAETQYGSIPQFEAVDSLGNQLEFDKALPGDLLKIVGISSLFTIESVEGPLLRLTSGLPSNLSRAVFEVQSAAAKSYNDMEERLTTYTSSPNLLKKHKFDEGLELLEAAVTAAILPGRNFASSRNQARRIVVDLYSILTSSPRRSDEYTVDVPVVSLNLEDILVRYVAAQVPAVDRAIDSFGERQYDRAVDLLRRGKLKEFYDTNQETGSYAGNMMVASRKALADLPEKPTQQVDVEREANLAVSAWEVPDADFEFDDVDDAFETDIDE